MSYTIDFTDKPNNGSITVDDQTVNAEKDIKFVGKNYTGYAKVIAENFLHLLENFTADSEPSNPVKGQLWYFSDSTADPDTAQPQLKVYDGTNWQPAGGIKKSASTPAQSVVGDLWVDTANQQLYLWTGSSWLLIGPQFSEGTLTGPKVEQVVDTFSSTHNIITFYVSDTPIAIIAREAFVPKLTIDGFSEVKKGINLRDFSFATNKTTTDFRITGTATDSERLGSIPANNFVRNDINSLTNGSFSIRNNTGLIIGSDLTASLSNNANGETVLYNKTEGSRIFIRANVNGQSTDTVTVSGINVGINKTNPVYALDVSGTIRTDDTLIVSGTNNANDLLTGSLRTAGGASITKTLQVGQGMTVLGTSNTNSILPVSANSFDIGSAQVPFKNIYANSITASSFSGQFTGTFVGSVTGSASRLASPTAFSIAGDITTVTPVSFTGQNGGAVVLNTTINQDFISSKTQVATPNDDDSILINRPSVGLRRITVEDLFATRGIVPVGGLMPYSGLVAPNGFVLCDGSEYLLTEYPELFAIIGYRYKAIGLLLGEATFAVPDLRGRFPLGADNMFSGHEVPMKGTSPIDFDVTIATSAGRVTSTEADNIGSGTGNEDIALSTEQLPDHKHDLRGTTPSGDKGQQYFAFRNTSDPTGDVDVVEHTTLGPSILNTGKYLTNSGGVLSPVTGSPVQLMNPYLTINYIIFTGKYI
jgi:microcystin-dependent protein